MIACRESRRTMSSSLPVGGTFVRGGLWGEGMEDTLTRCFDEAGVVLGC